MLRVGLERFGADVTTVASAEDALDILLTWRPHVLVSDIGMPTDDGYDLIKKVRALPSEQGGNVPAIALTGYVELRKECGHSRRVFRCLCPNLSKFANSAQLSSAF